MSRPSSSSVVNKSWNYPTHGFVSWGVCNQALSLHRRVHHAQGLAAGVAAEAGVAGGVHQTALTYTGQDLRAPGADVHTGPLLPRLCTPADYADTWPLLYARARIWLPPAAIHPRSSVAASWTKTTRPITIITMAMQTARALTGAACAGAGHRRKLSRYVQKPKVQRALTTSM